VNHYQFLTIHFPFHPTFFLPCLSSRCEKNQSAKDGADSLQQDVIKLAGVLALPKREWFNDAFCLFLRD
jgi:hypothetical protein